MQKRKISSYQNTRFTKGFWAQKQKMTADITLQAVRDRFTETGRMDAWDFGWREGMENKPHIFWDSDIAKWIESAAYSLKQYPDPENEAFIDAMVEKLVYHQGPDGYFNSYFQAIAPTLRWQDRTQHELYCAGHLIEAAIAYAEVTGKTAFVNAMIRYADHIDRVFRKEKTAAFVTPGHEEIELALVKLYHYTGDRKYLELSQFFIDERGKHSEVEYGFAKDGYAQDQAPVREQKDLEGHSVRAMYLLSGMADVAGETGDESLFAACRRLFESAVFRRMYITGGLGSTTTGEAFTLDYDLPNDTAYAETCAAIALVFFGRRMSSLDPDSVYADAVERALYNGFLSGISLSGDEFFYVNPLEIDPRMQYRYVSTSKGDNPAYPITQRKKVFSCSCCPPNVSRLIASFGDLLYSWDEETLYVHHYADSVWTQDGFALTQKTDYPWNGRITLQTEAFSAKKLAMRIPGWCEQFTLLKNGAAAEFELKKGYACISAQSGDVFTLDLVLEPQFMEADPRVQPDCGRFALQMGPLVYCLEGVDNGAVLRDLRIDASASPKLLRDEVLGQKIIYPARRRKTEGFEKLYRKAGAEYIRQEAVFVPYYAFANRGETELLVWFMADHLE